VVRGIAASAIKALARGATVLNERRRSIAPLNRTQLDRLLPLLTRETNEVVETGIKVIDVMCPIRAGGSVALAGENGAGTTVVMEEIVRRIGNSGHPVTLLVLFPPPSELWPPSLDANYSIADELKKEGYSEGTVGSVQTFFVGGKKGPWTAEELENFAPVDTLIHLSRQMILRKNYPGVDVTITRSRLLDNELVGQEEVLIARSARNAIGSLRLTEANPTTLADAIALERARKVQAFFSQPFFVAEPYTKRPGSHVSRADALRGCREILDGRHDDLPAAAFYFTGSIEEIRRAAGSS
jgi:F-type H+/Na+-transporting ATPase subunit beta